VVGQTRPGSWASPVILPARWGAPARAGLRGRVLMPRVYGAGGGLSGEVFADKGAAAVDADDQAAVAEDFHGVTDGVERDTVVLG